MSEAKQSRAQRLAYACPQCHGAGRVIAIGKYVANMACACGEKWITHATAEMMTTAEETRAAAIAKATAS